jgi:archaellum component FlaC
MYRMSEGWTDERMDDFRGEVNRRFDKVDRQFDNVDERFDKMDERFERFEDRFAALQRTLLVSNGAIIAGLIGVIATQI